MLDLTADLSLNAADAAPEVTTGAATPRTEIAFIDTGVQGYQAMVDAMHPGVEVVLIDSTKDGLAQIAEALAGRTGVDAVHVFSHGEAGLLALGSARVTLGTLEGYSAELAAIRAALSDDADLLVYGCDVAAGETGAAFVQALAEATGADIAASEDLTGSAALGGDWVLEASSGSIEAASIEVTAFSSVLAGGTITFSSPSGGAVIADYTATDGDNGSSDIVGKTIDVYAFDPSNGSKLTSGGTLKYVDPTTSGWDGFINSVTWVDDGSRNYGLAIRSSDGSNFSISSLKLGEWGNTSDINIVVKAFDGGIETGSQQFTINTYPNGWNFGNIINLNPTYFSNVDEVKIYRADGSSWLSINNIVIGGVSPSVDLNGTAAANASASFVEATHQGTSSSNGVLIAPSALLTDDGTVNTVVVSLNSQSDPGERLFLSGTFTGVTYTLDSANQITLTRTGTTAHLETALRAIRYQNNDDSPSTTARTVTVTATDDAGSSSSETVTVSVAGTNDNPDLANLDGDATEYVLEEGGYIDNEGTGLVELSDPDLDDVSGSLNGGNLTITSDSPYSGGSFSFDPDIAKAGASEGTADGVLSAGDKVFVFDQENGWVEVGVVSSEEDGQGGHGLIIVFTTDNATPRSIGLLVTGILYTADAEGERGFSLTVDDGQGGISEAAAFTMNGSFRNAAPVLDASKSPVLTGVAEDAPAPANGSTDGSTLVSSLVGTTGIANYSDDDGDPAGIAITGVSSQGTLYYSTNGGASWTALTGTVSDSSALVLSGTDRVYFKPNAEVNGPITDAITFKAWDGTDGVTSGTGGVSTTGRAYSSASDTASVTVTGVNDAPTVSVELEDQDATEDAAFTFTVPATAFSDVDAGTTLTYTATLADGSDLPAWLSFDAATRTFTGTPLNGDVGPISVTVTASDGTDTVSDQFTLTVANTNDAPVITSHGGDATVELSFAEESPDAITTVTADDVDEGDTLTYSLSGDNADLFAISATGALTFKTPPAYTAGGANSYAVTVTVKDGQDAPASQSFTVEVLPDLDRDGTPDRDDTDIDNDGTQNSLENPVPNPSGTGTGDGNGDGIADAAQINVASLPTVGSSYATLAVADGLTITGISNEAAPVSGLPRGAKMPLGQFGFTVGGVTPGGSASVSLFVDKALGLNTYYKQNYVTGKWDKLPVSLETVGSKTKISFTLTDGGAYDADGVANGVIVDPGVAAVIEPRITSDGGTGTGTVEVAENGTAVTTVTATAESAVTYAITGGVDAGLFAIDAATGALTFVAAPDFEAPADRDHDNVYRVRVTATDEDGHTDTQILSVTVTDVEERVDGVLVTTETRTGPDGRPVEVVVIPTVTGPRQDVDPTTVHADIPLVTSGAERILSLEVPEGFGAEVEAHPAATTARELLRAIRAHTVEGSADQAQMLQLGRAFLAGLDPAAALTVRTIVPTVSGTSAPDKPLVIHGLEAGGPQQAVVIDGTGLPPGTVIVLDHVEFAAVVGPVTVTSGGGAQVVIGDGSGQVFRLGAGNDQVSGGAGRDVVSGGSGDDRVLGGLGADRLLGRTGDDRISGGAGADRLDGGLGKDRLWGGSGADVFIFRAVEESGRRADEILDFETGRDQIDLSGIDADLTSPEDQAFAWVDASALDAAFTGQAGQLRFAGGVLRGDVDGDGRADLRLVVHGALSAHDLIL